MNGNERYIDHVAEVLSYRDALEALAEECCELAQAAMKVIRANKLDGCANMTPMQAEEARMKLIEESMDVCSVMTILELLPHRHEVMDYEKWERWAKRLGFQEG